MLVVFVYPLPGSFFLFLIWLSFGEIAPEKSLTSLSIEIRKGGNLFFESEFYGM
jgi:hypothetical protein